MCASWDLGEFIGFVHGNVGKVRTNFVFVNCARELSHKELNVTGPEPSVTESPHDTTTATIGSTSDVCHLCSNVRCFCALTFFRK